MGTARALGIGIACLQLALWSGCKSDSEGDAPNAGAGGAVAGTGGAGGLLGGNGGLLGGSGGVSGAAGMVVAGMSGSGGAGGVFAGAGSGGVGGIGGFGAVGGNGEAGGSEGNPTAGTGGTGGATGMGSMGCGNTSPPADGDQTIDVDGTEREFIVAVPDGYDPNMPHKLVFAWHGLGGMASQIAGGFRGGYYGLEPRAMGSTIFVAGQGLDTSNSVGSGPGWDNMGGRDVAFTAAMLEWLRSNYCIDNDRIFSVGMSYGGIMSNTVGCALGDDFRAIAPIAGMGPSAFGGGGACTGQVAAWIAHGNMDNVVQFSSGEGSRDHWVEANHCDSTSMPSGDNCVAYDGCDDGMPVVWCEFDGGHTVPSFASEEIWAFFSQF